MRTGKFYLIVSLYIFVFVSTVTASGIADWTYRVIDDSYSYNSDISGSNVVWQAHDGNDYEIFLYDGTTITQLTDNSGNDQNPKVSGNNVVWSGFDGSDNEIYLYNGATTIQLSDNAIDDSNPVISGANVAWTRSENINDRDIFLYSGSLPATPLTDDSNINRSPQISGTNVVWTQSDGSDQEIYLYDGTTKQLTNNSLHESGPQISGTNVVWSANDNNIYFYNGTSTTQLTTSGVDGYPHICGANIVWEKLIFGNSEIYHYNIDTSTTTQISSSPYRNMYPYISGASVVWVKSIYGGDFDTDMDTVYLHDIDSGLTFRISYPGAYGYIGTLRVSGANIAWSTGSQILLAEKHCVTPLLADINNDCTVDIGDLNITALQWLDFGTPLTAGCQ